MFGGPFVTALLFGLIYAALAASLVACGVRAARYARMPLHLRWELYPVPHEDRKRSAYGGSRYEEVDWWKSDSHPNRFGELKAMASEILFLKGLWEFNRRLWWCSYPFHLGLYLLILTGVAVTAAALVPAAAPALHIFYLATGLSGAVLVVCGAAGLLHRRLSDAKLRSYTTAGDIFNLFFFIVTVLMLLAAYVSGGPGVARLIKALLTFDTALAIPGLEATALALAALLILYIPLTHMAHFIAKYFTYHSIRWDDLPNRHERSLESRIAEQLAYKPTWSATHVGAGEGATWAGVATTEPPTGAKK
jgi:nitrate reductase gamma subunit